MKTKKSLSTFRIGIFFATALFFIASVAMAEPIILKYSDPSSSKQARCVALKKWGDWLEKKTGNQIKIEYYWSKSLAKPKDNIKATKSQTLDDAL